MVADFKLIGYESTEGTMTLSFFSLHKNKAPFFLSTAQAGFHERSFDLLPSFNNILQFKTPSLIVSKIEFK